MATYYIDPINGSDGNTGLSHDQAFKTVPTITSNNNYYLLRGTEYSGTIRILDFDNVTNITFGSYYMSLGLEKTDDNTSEAKAKLSNEYLTSTDTGDWSQVGGDDVWVMSGLVGSNIVLGLGSLGWEIRSNYLGAGPATSGLAAFTDSGYGYGQWDYNSTNIYIYSDVNPATKWGAIYYTRDNATGISFRNSCTNITIENLDARYFYSGVIVNGNTLSVIHDNIIIDNCDFDHNWFAANFNLYTSGSVATNCQMVNCNTYDTGGFSAIRATGGGSEHTAGLIIRDNKMYRTGASEPVGAIYGKFKGSELNPVRIYDNYVDTVYTWNSYWVTEFRCYYLESGSTYANVYKNFGKNAEGGLHDNGGTYTVFYGNIIEDCTVGIGLSDSANIDNGIVDMHNNTLIGVFKGIDANRPASATDCNLHVYNNIFVADDSAGSTYCYVDNDLDDFVLPSGLVEDYNNYYGFDNEKIRYGGGTLTNVLGANNISTDPLLVSNYTTSTNSPCYHAGKVVSFSAKDYKGHKFNVPPTIGAYEFTSSSEALPRESA